MKKRNLLLRLLVVSIISGLTLFTTECKRGGDNSLKIAGSDTMVQLSQKLAQAYMKDNPGESVSVQGGGSGTGIAALLNESIHVADASRTMKDKEWELAKSKNISIKEHVIALDAMSVVINPDNPAVKLTIEQLSDIFSGKVKNWKEVGGKDAPILAISRENNSGTHVYFKEEVLRKGDSKSTLEFGKDITYAVSSQQIVDQIKANKNAIGYVGMGWVNKDVKAVSVLNEKDKKYYEPTMENAMAKKYPLSRTLQMYVNEKFNEKAMKFINYALSEKGEGIVKELGFIPNK
ncbi:MAG: phosphate ABC transporter substrate-binding protein [Spirochaetia bacterium]|nr:phosphate ABC transporter substrate-binding protein [Spirochaetia bacterium]